MRLQSLGGLARKCDVIPSDGSAVPGEGGFIPPIDEESVGLGLIKGVFRRIVILTDFT